MTTPTLHAALMDFLRGEPDVGLAVSSRRRTSEVDASAAGAQASSGALTTARDDGDAGLRPATTGRESMTDRMMAQGVKERPELVLLRTCSLVEQLMANIEGHRTPRDTLS